jgi:hypothetical protein
MQRVKGRRPDFTSQKKMTKIGARTRATGVTPALGVERASVFRIARVLDVEAAAGGEQLAVPRVAGGQDAVEQVYAPGH